FHPERAPSLAAAATPAALRPRSPHVPHPPDRLIANPNACEYCLAAHTVLGRKAGASAEEMSEAQAGRSDDPKTAAALRFALAVVERRGQVEAGEVAALRVVGFDDGEIVELLAHAALNL